MYNIVITMKKSQSYLNIVFKILDGVKYNCLLIHLVSI